MDPLHRYKNWYGEHLQQLKEDYFAFLRFPSISADPEYRKDVLDCARWLSEYLRRGGLKSEEISTSGYPIVYAEDLSAGPGKPTVLIYGHYDVQPVDPLELWQSPPFEPTERDGKVFARGAVDDKGQIFYACLAAICWKSLGLCFPANVKFCIEGEEESSSAGILKALPELKKKFSADSLLIVDFGAMDEETPSLTFGARGIIALEVTLTGSKGDLHSGTHGGLAYNPNRALAELLSKLWDKNGRVAVPGFYDDVADPPNGDLYTYPFTKELLERDFGIKALGSERGKSLVEANWFLPSLDINGMSGGYTGAGMKTVIPSQASAKITCRLVRDQDPDKVLRSIGEFLQKNAVKGMDVKVALHGGVGAFRGNPHSPLAKALAAASTQAAGKKCVNIFSGGSIPIAAELMKALKIDVVGMGYGLATDNIHAPNEHFDMNRFEKGFLTVARGFELL